MAFRETSADHACNVILADSVSLLTRQLHRGTSHIGCAVAILPVMRRLTSQVIAMLWPDLTQLIRIIPVQVDMKINLCASAKSVLTNWLQLLVVSLMLAFLSPASATDSQPYPEFTAVYDARINGFLMAEANFSLHRMDNGDYVYQRKLTSVGVASLFGKKVSTATSRWRFINNRIQVLEYQSSNEDGDADDNLHLVFNWKTTHVKNLSTADPWQTKIPAGTLDKLVMQLALLFELRDGSTEFQYPVPHEGRIKHYRFKQIGKEKIELPIGEFNTLVVERLDDDRDNTRIWSVPELNYFPVRFLEHKKSGVKKELSLRKVKFINVEDSD
jgi:hypothetical protein